MITCARCGARLEDGSLYCEECGASLRTDKSNTEHPEKLESLNKQLAEAADKNTKNNLEIEKLKEDLKEKDGEINNYINQINAGKADMEKIKSRRNGVIVGYIAALVISISVGAASYNKAMQERDAYYDRIAPLERENNDLKNQLASFENRSEELRLERDNLQREVEELKRAAADIKIGAISIGNTLSGKMIDDYGAILYANKIRYLATRITYDSRITGNQTFNIKIIKPSGALMRGSSSPADYSYNTTIYINKGINRAYLSSWGNQSGGSYSSGTYTVEVWHKDLRLGSTSVTLH
jgi:regulator of replication initiation timing